MKALLFLLFHSTFSLNCLKQTFPQFYYPEIPTHHRKDLQSFQIETLAYIGDTKQLLLVGSLLEKFEVREGLELVEKVRGKAFYMRVKENGANDNLNYFEYARGVSRIE